MSVYKIALVPGDGIGPEQSEATLTVLRSIEEKTGLSLKILEAEAGDVCFQKCGVALPENTVKTIKNSDVCLKGPIGETAADVVVKLRQMFDLYINLRPAKAYPHVPSAAANIDLVIVRENTEDLYKGYEFMLDEGTAIALRVITKECSRRIADFAFRLAEKRRRKVTAVHKSNVMKLTCGLFSKVCREVSKAYPEVDFQELYVDAASMHLIKRPQTFDVILTPNLFGDILSEEKYFSKGKTTLLLNYGAEILAINPFFGKVDNILVADLSSR